MANNPVNYRSMVIVIDAKNSEELDGLSMIQYIDEKLAAFSRNNLYSFVVFYDKQNKIWKVLVDFYTKDLVRRPENALSFFEDFESTWENCTITLETIGRKQFNSFFLQALQDKISIMAPTKVHSLCMDLFTALLMNVSFFENNGLYCGPAVPRPRYFERHNTLIEVDEIDYSKEEVIKIIKMYEARKKRDRERKRDSYRARSNSEGREE